MIERLGLEPLPGEGGYFRHTWAGPPTAGRPAGTAILFLMTEQDFSALHRCDADEVWLFQAGDPIEHVQLGPTPGEISVATLGTNVLGGHSPQVIARAGAWQGARLVSSGFGAGWALLGCTMSPGWWEKGFELGRREELLTAYPKAAWHIRALTRGDGF